jgi:hypothetical protein
MRTARLPGKRSPSPENGDWCVVDGASGGRLGTGGSAGSRNERAIEPDARGSSRSIVDAIDAGVVAAAAARPDVANPRVTTRRR